MSMQGVNHLIAFCHDLLHLAVFLLLGLSLDLLRWDWHDDDMERGDSGRDYKSQVVTVRHDHDTECPVAHDT